MKLIERRFVTKPGSRPITQKDMDEVEEAIQKGVPHKGWKGNEPW